MSIMRLGYIHARVTDMDEAKNHYGQTLGLHSTLEQDGRVYYMGWDEWDHHSVVLEEGGVGAVKFGWKVGHESDIDAIEKSAAGFGCLVERMSAGDNPEVSDGIRIVTPSDHVMEIYHAMTLVGTEVGDVNPEAFPRHRVGVGCPTLDHALITGEDIDTLERFFHEVFGLRTAEKIATGLEDDAHRIACWLSNNNTIHQIAILEGPQAKIHHFAFRLDDWAQIGHAADIFSMDDVPIDVGPTRHGITRGQTIYFFDPAGNRNEVFAGGYLYYPDRPTVTWTPDMIGKGIFYHSRELNDRFTTVFT
jgi:catechol 2,3-dioxygenase